MNIETEFQMGETVYHAVTGDKGIVIDCRYMFQGQHIDYFVSFGPSESSWCDAQELSRNKVLF